MRICFVGDSMVNGTGDPEYLGWVGRVLRDERRRHPELTGYNLGIRRDTSADILARWSVEVTRRLPGEFEGRVVFSFGVNDCVQGIEAAETLANATAMIEEAKVRWSVLMVGPPPIPRADMLAPAAAPDAAFAMLCAKLGVPYLPVFGDLMQTPIWLDEARAGDGAHPGAGGYERMAELVLASETWRHWMAPPR